MQSNTEAEIILPIINHLIIAKDGLGNAYLPEWNFMVWKLRTWIWIPD